MEKPILVTRPFLPSKEEYSQYLDQIWESRWMTNQGPLHNRFSEELKSYLGVDNITLTVNGHNALEIALRGLRIHGEVITTPFTFASTVHSISLAGLTPVFCDVRNSDLTIDPEQIESLITQRTEAIMPVHVYGHPCDTETIERIARKHNLRVIYDAAHAFGVKVGGRSILHAGDASILSFHATKLFNTIEGGAIAFNDSRYRQIFDMFKNFGIEDEEHIPYVGGNGKMNEFQAAMGLANLPHVPEILENRKKYTLLYRERLAACPGLRLFVPESDTVEYNYAYLPVLITREAPLDRDTLCDKLREKDIFVRKYFYPLLSECSCYRHLSSSAEMVNAREASRTVITLPLYYGMGEDTVNYVCDSIQELWEKM